MTVMHDFNPVIFEKRRPSAPFPWHKLGRALELARGIKFAVGKRQVKRILRSRALSPLVVPIAFLIRYVRV